jgi:hypothetical protein
LVLLQIGDVALLHPQSRLLGAQAEVRLCNLGNDRLSRRLEVRFRCGELRAG